MRSLVVWEVHILLPSMLESHYSIYFVWAIVFHVDAHHWIGERRERTQFLYRPSACVLGCIRSKELQQHTKKQTNKRNKQKTVGEMAITLAILEVYFVVTKGAFHLSKLAIQTIVLQNKILLFAIFDRSNQSMSNFYWWICGKFL